MEFVRLGTEQERSWPRLRASETRPSWLSTPQSPNHRYGSGPTSSATTPMTFENFWQRRTQKPRFWTSELLWRPDGALRANRRRRGGILDRTEDPLRERLERSTVART